MNINNKKLLFIGPMGNPTQSFVNNYDLIIRTNNFFSIKKNVLFSYKCDILFVNGLCINKCHRIINKNMHKLK